MSVPPLTLELVDDLTHALWRYAFRAQPSDGDALSIRGEPEQEVLRPDERAVALRGERGSAVDHIREFRGQDEPAACCPISWRLRSSVNPSSQVFEVDLELFPRAPEPRGIVRDKREQEMFGADSHLLFPPGLPVRPGHDAARFRV